jgi:hypothetical protein
MRAHLRYPDRLEGSGKPLMLDCVRTPPGSTVRRALDLTGVTARITVRRYGGTEHGETVISAAATASTEVAHRFEYVPTPAERRLLTLGSYQAYWLVTRNGVRMPYGPIDLSVVDSPFSEFTEGTGLLFHLPSNSGLLAAI